MTPTLIIKPPSKINGYHSAPFADDVLAELDMSPEQRERLISIRQKAEYDSLLIENKKLLEKLQELPRLKREKFDSIFNSVLSSLCATIGGLFVGGNRLGIPPAWVDDQHLVVCGVASIIAAIVFGIIKPISAEVVWQFFARDKTCSNCGALIKAKDTPS